VDEAWLETKLTFACGTDEDSQRRHREDLAAAGFDVLGIAVDYVADLDLDQRHKTHLTSGMRKRPGIVTPARRSPSSASSTVGVASARSPSR
jgi:hypothetical protein